MGFRIFWDQVSQDDLLSQARIDPQGRAMTELIRRYEPLTHKIARTITGCRETQEDIRNEARLGLFQAVLRHTPGLPGFATYAELTMRGAAIRWMRAWTSLPADSLDGAEEPVAPETVVTDWGDGELADVVRMLPVRQQELLSMRYIEDAELATIADLRSVSESAISQQLRTVHRKLVLHLAA